MSSRALFPAVRSAACVVLCVAASPAHAFEYPLQYTVVGNYEDLVVAGYGFDTAGHVTGNCSYTRITHGSGRGGKTTYTPVPQTCTWDVHGVLLSTASGAPVAPTPIEVLGTETIYAMPSADLYAGYDSALGTGFVFHAEGHYTWLTSNAHVVIPRGPYYFNVQVAIDGEKPVNVTAVKVKKVLTGAIFRLQSTTCLGLQSPGSNCTISLGYDAERLCAPSGLVYDTLTVHLSSDASLTHDWVQGTTDEVLVGDGCGGG